MTDDPNPPPREYVSLLTQVMTNTLDEDYATLAEKRRAAGESAPTGTRPSNLGLVAVLIVFGLMVGISAIKTDQERPQTQAERAELIAQIHHRQDDQAALSSRLNQVQDDVTSLQKAVAGQTTRGAELAARVQLLSTVAGTVPVVGPGLVITTDDAGQGASDFGGTILDTDLQALANGLWAAGAEAISINGHRLTTLTAIRIAGTAITVDNVSLSPPYVIHAIGDPATLPARLLETGGGQTWLGLEANFGIRFDRQTRENITVPGDPHEYLLYARPEKAR